MAEQTDMKIYRIKDLKEDGKLIKREEKNGFEVLVVREDANSPSWSGSNIIYEEMLNADYYLLGPSKDKPSRVELKPTVPFTKEAAKQHTVVYIPRMFVEFTGRETIDIRKFPATVQSGFITKIENHAIGKYIRNGTIKYPDGTNNRIEFQREFGHHCFANSEDLAEMLETVSSYYSCQTVFCSHCTDTFDVKYAIKYLDETKDINKVKCPNCGEVLLLRCSFIGKSFRLELLPEQVSLF